MIDNTLNQSVLDIENLGPCKASDKGQSKNVLCPYYGNCIDWALKENWTQFSCQDCSFKNYHRTIYPNADEVKGCYRLLSNIFPV